MKLRFILCSLMAFGSVGLNASIIFHNPIKITPKVIYGSDDREEIFESSDSLMQELSRSTAAKIPNESLIFDGDSYTLKSKSLKEWQNLCSSERFIKQSTAATCSGFLISSDVIVTAGHCIYSVNDCTNNSWVFDYTNTTEEKAAFSFNQNQIYHCTKIIAREKNNETMNDYAVIKLDRPVTGRLPLKIRHAGKIEDDAVLTVIGNPSGLPIKITSGAELRDNSNPIFFTTNADTYGRNSGSAVINSRTGIVEGILVRGDVDFAKSSTEDCSVSVHHDQSSGRGEDVTRITNIKILSKAR
ncbi:MAG: serine protease [Bacteriovorax sp.]|nr:serine protease [Bacteriovorax sp.]